MKFLSILALLVATTASADPVEIKGVTTSKAGDAWRFDVTLLHPDAGWDHYADAWEIVDENGTRIGIRELAHPHVNEQPFTRSLNGVTIPDGIKTVYVRARCNDNGWSEDRFAIELN